VAASSAYRYPGVLKNKLKSTDPVDYEIAGSLDEEGYEACEVELRQDCLSAAYLGLRPEAARECLTQACVI
jgi:hypothetical protein